MRRVLLVIVILALIVGTAAPSFGRGWWWICWRQVVIGTERGGHKVYCNECYVEFREKRGKRPPGNCESFLSRRSAERFYNQTCDCPGGSFPR
jgi:hypothetical protein